MKLLRWMMLFVTLSFYCNNFACTGGTSAGSLTPTTSYQTVNYTNGYYYSINVTSCATYYFTFCSDGGTAAYDTQITLLDNAGVTQLDYNDDFCGLLSQVTWTATFTGTIRVLITLYDCDLNNGYTGTLAYKYTPKSGDYCLTDDAVEITVGGETCIQLTSETNNQTGCAWNDDLIDFNYDFTFSLDYYFGNNVSGADGTTFTFQPNSLTSCGVDGGEIGAGSLSNSLVIEFDTYDNDDPVHAIDIAADHIAVETDGSLLDATHYAGPIAAIAGGANIDDGALHSVDITWNAGTQTLNIYFDGNLRLTTTGDFVTNVFGGDNTVYWGATAATGGMNNQQYFCPSTVVVLPVELASFESTCNEKYQYLNWTTESENHLDHFVVESTKDGKQYQTVTIVKACGNSTSRKSYQYALETADPSLRYYRLKMVDTDGNFKTTGLIIPKICNDHSTLLNNYTFSNGNLALLFNEENVTYSLYTISGQMVIPPTNNREQVNQHLLLLEAKQGVYLLKIEAENAKKSENVKLFHTVE